MVIVILPEQDPHEYALASYWINFHKSLLLGSLIMPINTALLREKLYFG